MKKKSSWFLFGCLVFQFVFCSCVNSDKRMENFSANYSTPVDQLDFFVSEAKGDVAMVARMLGEDVSYLEDVHSGRAVPTQELICKLNDLSEYYNYAYLDDPWLDTRRHYGEKHWYDTFIYIV